MSRKKSRRRAQKNLVSMRGLLQLGILTMQICVWLNPKTLPGNASSDVSFHAISEQIGAFTNHHLGTFALFLPLITVVFLARKVSINGWRRLWVGFLAGSVITILLAEALGLSWLDGGTAGALAIILITSPFGVFPGLIPLLFIVCALTIAWSLHLLDDLSRLGNHLGNLIERLTKNAADTMTTAGETLTDTIESAIEGHANEEIDAGATQDSEPINSNEPPCPPGPTKQPKKLTEETDEQKADSKPAQTQQSSAPEVVKTPAPISKEDSPEDIDDHSSTSNSQAITGKLETDSFERPTRSNGARLEGPADQAILNASEVHDLIKESVATLSDVPLGDRHILVRKSIRLIDSLETITRGGIVKAVDQAFDEYHSIVTPAKADAARARDVTECVEDMETLAGADFDWVAGMNDLKARLETAIAGCLDPEEIKAVEAVTGKRPSGSGVLLYGAPGTGKTFVARAAAGEYARRYGLRFINVETQAVKGIHWSKKIERLGDIFEFIKERAPCIVLWDEIDGVASDPEMGGRKYDRETSTIFKQQLDRGDTDKSPIIHIGTTNFPEQLELALVRPGRLSPIHIGPPDPKARWAIMEMYLAQRSIENIDIETLVKWTASNTAVEIKQIFEEVDGYLLSEMRESRTKEPRARQLEDFERAKNSLKTKGFAAWLSKKKHILKQPKASDRREAYKEILEMKRFETPEI